jgi:hypothetical protein
MVSVFSSGGAEESMNTPTPIIPPLRYRLRVNNGNSKDGDAYIIRRLPDGIPVFTWEETTPMSREDIDALKRDADRLCGGNLYVEQAWD